MPCLSEMTASSSSGGQPVAPPKPATAGALQQLAGKAIEKIIGKRAYAMLEKAARAGSLTYRVYCGFLRLKSILFLLLGIAAFYVLWLVVACARGGQDAKKVS